MKITPAGLAGLIDHTLLKAEATYEQISTLCREAAEYGFKAVCLNPCFVTFACRELIDTPVVVCSVIGFPLGAAETRIKAAEAVLAVSSGAGEVDVVMNIGYLKSGMLRETGEDLSTVVNLVKQENPGAIVKVIIETCLLTQEEKKTACRLVAEAGSDFIKTSTGFSLSGAKRSDVWLLRQAVGPDLGVKASGGIRTLDAGLAMLEAGANRLGVSAGVSIIDELRRREF